jgi:hypothetical protein
MKTRLWILVVASLFPVSNALAQDAGEQEKFEQPGITQGDIVGPLPPAVGRISCFKLEDEPNFCVLPDRPHIINHTIPFNIVDINGAYVDQTGNVIYISVLNAPTYNNGYTIDFDLSLIHRPHGIGFFTSGSQMTVYFPDDQTYTATFEFFGYTIRWSNGTVWNRQ